MTSIGTNCLARSADTEESFSQAASRDAQRDRVCAFRTTWAVWLVWQSQGRTARRTVKRSVVLVCSAYVTNLIFVALQRGSPPIGVARVRRGKDRRVCCLADRVHVASPSDVCGFASRRRERAAPRSTFWAMNQFPIVLRRFPIKAERSALCGDCP